MTDDTDKMEDISLADRVKSLCIGKPAKIPWPHRELHEIASEIEAMECLIEAYQTEARKRKGPASDDTDKLAQIAERWRFTKGYPWKAEGVRLRSVVSENLLATAKTKQFTEILGHVPEDIAYLLSTIEELRAEVERLLGYEWDVATKLNRP